MNDSVSKTPPADNEPVLSYAPGSPERARLKDELDRIGRGRFDIPLVIGGKELRTGQTAELVRPDARQVSLGRYHLAGAAEANF